MNATKRPPALLTNPDYYGTLAAVRCLGRAGVPVTMLRARRLAPAGWSRFVRRGVVAPTADEPERFVDWLLEFGRREPGHVLYPTSDDVAWLIAERRDELAEFYHLYQPPLATIRRLLDKRELFALGEEVGLASPRTFFADGDAAIDEIARHAPFPLLLKPRMQVLLSGHGKGITAQRPDALRDAVQRFRETHRPHPRVLAQVPGADWPMLQVYHPEAAEGIHSVAGFVDRAGNLTALAARKVLQRPRKLGIGLCFEAVTPLPHILDGLAALCRRAGYHGVFEAEFIEVGGQHLFIDFNPRFYSQMAFEVARGLPLPLMAYEAALGREPAPTPASVGPRLAASHAAPPAGRAPARGYTHHLILGLTLRLQRLSGRLSPAEAARWHAWLRDHRGLLADAVADADDPVPKLVDTVGTLYAYARHPRAFVRTMVLNQ